jgi:hypothetical protein
MSGTGKRGSGFAELVGRGIGKSGEEGTSVSIVD